MHVYNTFNDSWLSSGKPASSINTTKQDSNRESTTLILKLKLIGYVKYSRHIKRSIPSHFIGSLLIIIAEFNVGEVRSKEKSVF